MRVMVVGGAGYIGAHTVRALKKSGHEPIIFDNLITGHRAVASLLDVPLIEGDLNHPGEIHAALERNPVDAVMHFAAFANVGESVNQPVRYYQNNVVGSFQLLDAMRSYGVGSIIFSSTCATYGNPLGSTLDENHPQLPINPYGRTKLMVEQMLRDFHAAFGLRYASLRYFNAAGASHDGLLGEEHHPESHLIPLCLQVAAGMRDEIVIFGDDYATPDGTCLRDYIHVEDLADAHLRALDQLGKSLEPLELNVGTGRGHSVREVVRCCETVADFPIKVKIGPRRAGDPPILVAAADKIRAQLGWKPRYTELSPIVESAWRWFKNGGRYGNHPY